MLDERLTFEFDLNGFAIVPRVLAPAQVARMNAIIDASAAAQLAHKFHFLELDRAFVDLLTHPTVCDLCASWLHAGYRFDHAFGIQHRPGEEAQRESLHGGPWAEQGFFQYHWHAGRPRCTSLLFGFVLEPQRRGDGGLVCVPGSHKSNVGLDGGEVLGKFLDGDYGGAPWIVQPELEAGDLVVMTEATMHGTVEWRARERRRRILYYQFAIGCAAWLAPDAPQLAGMRELARTDTERKLLRPAYVSARSGNVQAFREPTLRGGELRANLERAGTSLGRWLAARVARWHA